MIQVTITQRSVAQVDAYLEATRNRIFAAVRVGMNEAMQGLAEQVASKLNGNPIVTRTGKLLAAVLAGAKVRETRNAIIGSVKPDTHDGRNLAQWLEEGHAFPGKRKRFLEAKNLLKIGKNARNHPDFQSYIKGKLTGVGEVPAHPFMNPALREYETTIMEIISGKVADALVD